jgi:flagellar assembly protein FliH
MSGFGTTPSLSTDARPGSAAMTEGWLDVASMPPPHVLIVEDDPAISRLLVEIVKPEGYQVSAVACAQAALDLLKKHPADILLTDFKLPDRDGLSLLEQVMREDARTVGIVMTGFGTVDLAVKAMKLGALDILIKPFEPDQVTILLNRVRELQRLRHENGLLKQAVVRGAGVHIQNFQLEELERGVHGHTEGRHADSRAVAESDYQRGVQDGERRAREQAAAVQARQQGLLASAIAEFERARVGAIAAVEDQAADLALAIASKIVRACVDEKHEFVQAQVREAVSRVRECRDVMIRVHPEDLPSIEGLRAALLPLFEGPVTMKIEGDPAVPRGGCVLETPTRFIDATIDAQLARVGEALKRDL